MRHRPACRLSFLTGCTTPPSSAAAAGIDPQADRCLRDMSQTLAAARQFTFRYRVASELLLVEGRPVPTATERRVAVRRPDGLAIVLTSSAGRRHSCSTASFVSRDPARNASAWFSRAAPTPPRLVLADDGRNRKQPTAASRYRW